MQTEQSTVECSQCESQKTPGAPCKECRYDSDNDDWLSTSEEEDCKKDEHDYRKAILEPMRTIEESQKSLTDLATLTNRYNLWAAILGGSASSSRPWTRARRAMQTRSKVDELLQQLGNEIRGLKHDIQNFNLGTAFYAHSDWYNDIEDLTDFDPLELEYALLGTSYRDMGSMDKIEEAEIYHFDDYADYVELMLPKAASRHDAQHDGSTYLRNVRTVIRKLTSNMPSGMAVYDLELRLWLVHKARVLRRDSPRLSTLQDWQLIHEHSDVDNEISEIFAWHAEDDSKIKYWNYARGFRILWESWNSTQLDTSGRDWSRKFKMSCGAMLHNIHKRASWELRQLTAYALTGIILPAELQEAIFESTMHAEGVPLELPPAHRPETFSDGMPSDSD